LLNESAVKHDCVDESKAQERHHGQFKVCLVKVVGNNRVNFAVPWMIDEV